MLCTGSQQTPWGRTTAVLSSGCACCWGTQLQRLRAAAQPTQGFVPLLVLSSACMVLSPCAGGFSLCLIHRLLSLPSLWALHCPSSAPRTLPASCQENDSMAWVGRKDLTAPPAHRCCPPAQAARNPPSPASGTTRHGHPQLSEQHHLFSGCQTPNSYLFSQSAVLHLSHLPQKPFPEWNKQWVPQFRAELCSHSGASPWRKHQQTLCGFVVFGFFFFFFFTVLFTKCIKTLCTTPH